MSEISSLEERLRRRFPFRPVTGQGPATASALPEFARLGPTFTYISAKNGFDLHPLL